MLDDLPSRERKSEPLLDATGQAVLEGKDATSFLWQVPEDEGTRLRIIELLEQIKRDSAAKGRREMPKICQEMLTAARAEPSPQSVDILQNGFERLYRLWSAAKSGLL
ncbi:MAG: hypothetical protein V3T74_08850 [Gemmatimonadales bacterium]